MVTASQNKHVVFDIVGTCITYEAFFEALEARLGERLRALNIGSRIFGYAWLEAAEKEYTYMTLSGAEYVKVFDVIGALFYRTLWQAGIQEPRKFANDEDRDFLLAAYRKLQPRDGLLECFEKLRAAGYTVWALTAGDTQRVNGYFTAAGINFPPKNFVSCDSIGIGKPSPASYQYLLDKLPEGDREAWFAAAHMWDTAGARYCGFKGAWVSAWEKDPCSDIFPQVEVVADDLPSMADGIIAYSSKK